MNRILTALGCLVLGLSLPVSAAKKKTEDPFNLRRDFSGYAMGAIRSLKSTRRHLRFIKEEDINMVVTSSRRYVGEDVIASFENGVIYVNPEQIYRSALELHQKGVAKDDIADMVAWKTVPVLIHELRHGMLEDEMFIALGDEIKITFIEEEVLCFFDEILTIREILTKRPSLWAKEHMISTDANIGILVGRWPQGLSGITEEVVDEYDALQKLAPMDRKTLLKRAEEAIGPFERLLAAMKSLPTASDHKKAQLEEDWGEELYRFPQAKVREDLKGWKTLRSLARSPKRFKALKEFYRKQMAWAERLWKREMAKE